MRIVDELLRSFRPTRRNDPVFGPMLYMGQRRGYWECKATFPPTSSVVEVFVDGSATNSMEMQHIFFKQLVQEWPVMSGSIGKMLLEKRQERGPDAGVESPWALFSISSLSIPSSSIEKAKWEISFAPLTNPDQRWTIQMEGRQPQQIIVDD